MNDSDLEKNLKALRPAPLRESFIARVEQAMAQPSAAENPPGNVVIRPARFQMRWTVGLSLAAAAALLLLVRVNFRPPEKSTRVASTSPIQQPVQSSRPENLSASGSSRVSTVPVNTLVPAKTTQIVYHKRDEGLLFAQNSDQPVRRLRSMTQETLQWRNPATGASLRVSYPSEQVQLIPVSGQ